MQQKENVTLSTGHPVRGATLGAVVEVAATQLIVLAVFDVAVGVAAVAAAAVGVMSAVTGEVRVDTTKRTELLLAIALTAMTQSC